VSTADFCLLDLRICKATYHVQFVWFCATVQTVADGRSTQILWLSKIRQVFTKKCPQSVPFTKMPWLHDSPPTSVTGACTAPFCLGGPSLSHAPGGCSPCHAPSAPVARGRSWRCSPPSTPCRWSPCHSPPAPKQQTMPHPFCSCS
jgi:hypothetical protein